MSTPVNPHDYKLRSIGKCTKYLAHTFDSPKAKLTTSCDHFETPKCKNCTSLSIDNDRLRRQIAILRSYIDKNSTNTNEVAVDCSTAAVTSTETQTPCIMLENTSCGTDDSLDPIKVHPITSSTAIGTDDSNQLITSADGINHIIWPYFHHDQHIFARFNVSQLHNDTAYSHIFGSRSVAYYGSQSYYYTGGNHTPQAFHDNIYLTCILQLVKELYPDYRFNSAMITYYANGEDWMPFHSDDEDCIAVNSSIMTISLGEKRSIKFKSKDTHSTPDTVLSLGHGDVLLMSQLSQFHYQHAIPKNSTSKLPRISITLRLLDKPPSDSFVHNQYQHFPSPVKVVQNLHSMERDKISSHSNQESLQKSGQKDRVIYISSSMFKSLDEKRLSSKSHDALVFSYSGATVRSMEEQFKSDQRLSGIDPKAIKTFVLMCGTNNIDDIIGSPRHMRDKLVNAHGPYNCNMDTMNETFKSIEHFVVYLKKWAPYANIKVLNILPRESRVRNEVITRINNYIGSLAQKLDYVEHPDSVFDRSYLFANKSGFRKSFFFSSQGEDNVHLNQKGVTRFARYLKYIAHNH